MTGTPSARNRVGQRTIRVGQFRVVNDEIWWDERVDADWWTSYRVVSDQGVPAVGEVRIYPYWFTVTRQRQPRTVAS